MTSNYPPCTYRVSAKAAIVVCDKLILVKEATEHWDLPGGGVEHGEELETALRREIEEEVNIQLTSIEANRVQPWITHDEESDRPLLFLVYRAITDHKLENGNFGGVEIGLFGEGELQTIKLVPYIEKYKEQLARLAFNK